MSERDEKIWKQHNSPEAKAMSSSIEAAHKLLNAHGVNERTSGPSNYFLLVQAVAAIRNEALEEAARELEARQVKRGRMSETVSGDADAIRALKLG